MQVADVNCKEKLVLSFNGVIKFIGTVVLACTVVVGIINADEGELTSDKDIVPSVAPFIKTTSVIKRAYPAPGAASTSKFV